MIIGTELLGRNNKEQFKPFLWFSSILETGNNERPDKTAIQHLPKYNYASI